MLRTVSGDCEPRRMGGFEFPYNKFPGFLLGYCKIVDLGDDVDVIKRKGCGTVISWFFDHLLGAHCSHE